MDFQTANREHLDTIYFLLPELDSTGLQEIEWWTEPEEAWLVRMSPNEFISHLKRFHHL